MTSQVPTSISRRYLGPRLRPFLRTAYFLDTIDIVEVENPAGLHGGVRADAKLQQARAH